MARHPKETKRHMIEDGAIAEDDSAGKPSIALSEKELAFLVSYVCS